MKSKTPMKPDKDHEEEATTNLSPKMDLCQQLMNRYAASSAAQHRHLIATAAVMRSVILSEHLPLTPTAYFAASISAIANPNSQSLDSDAVSALTAFMAMALSVVETGRIGHEKASEAVSVLVELVEKDVDGAGLLSAASVRSVVKCLGVLVGLCDLEDWNSVRLGMDKLLRFSVDKRPKVRRCSQICLETVFKSFQESKVVKEASKMILSFLRSYMPLAVELSSSRTEIESILSTPEHLEVLHMLNVLTVVVPLVSVKVNSTIFSELQKLITPHFSELTRHIIKIIEVLFGVARDKVNHSDMENLLHSLASYVTLGEKKHIESVMSAAKFLKSVFEELHAREPTSSITHLPSIIGSLAGILSSEDSSTILASNIVKDLINGYIGQQVLLTNQPFEDEAMKSIEIISIKSTCAIIENAIRTCDGSPNEHLLGVISVLLLKLGDTSHFFMKGIVLQLANMISLAGDNQSDTKHLQACIGSAVIAMGPEKILDLLPIILNIEDFACSNIWLIPILKSYVVGASLGYYMEHIVPLAKFFQRAAQKVKKSETGQDLQGHAHSLWGLLPSFCNHPTDTFQNVEPLIKLLIVSMKKKFFMHKIIAVSLQELVNQNKSVLSSKQDTGEINTLTAKAVKSYSKKTATRNIKALASCSIELLPALTDLFLDSPPAKRSYLQDAIGCLASISDSSICKKIVMSALQRFQLMNDDGELEITGSPSHASTGDEQVSLCIDEKNSQRCVMVKLASSLVEGAKEDLVNLIYDFVKHTFQETSEINHRELYNTISRILKQHAWCYSSRLVEVIDLLLGLKSPEDITTLKSRFATFHILMVDLVKGNLEEENTKAFLLLNEIVLRLKDSKEEARKVAYDTLLQIGSSLKNTSTTTLDTPYCKLINMIMGYLSGSSPQIKSGAVSALSVLVFQDADTCLSVPDLFPSMLTLLQSKTIEIIKAVLGFLKVLVSSLEAKDLQNLLSDIVTRILPWSSVSRHHFRSKVIVILEILIRKCGTAAVKFYTPDKFMSFIKTVLENRHGQASSKEGSNTEIQPISVVTSSKDKNMTHNDSEVNESFTSKKRKREKSQAGDRGKPGGDGQKWISNDEKIAKGEPHKKDFNKNPKSHGNKKTTQAIARPSNKTVF